MSLVSCAPNYCSDYVIQNELEQDISVSLYVNPRFIFRGDSAIKVLNIPSKERERIELLYGMSGGLRGLDLEMGTDSIHIILEDGRILKYTNVQPNNNIYDTRNRDIWVEEYGKRTKYDGGEYRYVFTIDESLIGD